MKILKNLFLSAGLTFTIFSCKDKAPIEDAAANVAAAEGIAYIAAPDMTIINWEGSKPTSKHTGTINVSDGKIYINNGKITSGNFTIDLNTISVTDITGEDKASLEAHLKGTEAEDADHFFNVTKFPVGKFEVTSVVDTTMENGVNTLVKGNLTLKGITKEISIPAKVSVSAEAVSVISNSFSINRTEWGINYRSKNIFTDLGDKFINDEIALQINLTAKPSPVQ